MLKRRKPFTRSKKPARLEPTKATTRVLKGIFTHEGVMSHKQIVKSFFPDCTSTWPTVRMTHYYDHHLIKKYDASFVNGEHLGEIIYTLDKAGFRYLSAKQCVQCGYIDPDLRSGIGNLICSRCRIQNHVHKSIFTKSSLTWRRNPRWSTLSHDLKINDFRIAVTLAAEASPNFELVNWISEYELSQGVKIPGRLDGFFLLRRKSPTKPNRWEELAILPEIDMANHPLGRFVKRKVTPALSFIGSHDYQQILGVTYGTCFVITTGQKRLENLKTKTEKAGGNGRFYFTTFDKVSEEKVLAKPIWQMAGSKMLFSIATMPLSPLEAGVLNQPAGLWYPYTS